MRSLHGLAAASFLAISLPGAASPPDLILHNAVVHTVDPARPRAGAVAIDDGRFVAVGESAEILASAGPETEIVDLRGMTVLPGLIDAHGHLAGLGQLGLGVVDLSGTRSYREVIELVAARAAESEPGTWIIGRGWDHESWPDRQLPHHDPLTAASPHHPVWLSRVDGHAGLANRAALELAGIDDHTTSPAGGEILRDESGRPTGVLVDNAESLIERAIPASVAGDPRAIVLEAQQRCFEVGLTGVHDMGVHPATIDLYRAMADAGELKLRVSAMLPANVALRHMAAHDPIDHPVVTARGVKLYMDGAMGSRGAWLLEPYADRPTGPDGEPYTGLAVSDAAFVEAVARLALERGYQVCTHAIGDRANREALDAYERAAASRGPDGPEALRAARFRIEHAQLLADADIPRFASMGVIPSMQPTHCTSDMRWVEDRVGRERARGAYAWRRLLDAGSRIAGGSDFPVESHNPFLGLHAAATRRNLEGDPPGGWRPEERMTREEALRGMTIDAAHASFHESTRGSITPGKLADLIVIDRDLMTCPEGDIPKIRVLMTIVGGEVVHRASGLQTDAE